MLARRSAPPGCREVPLLLLSLLAPLLAAPPIPEGVEAVRDRIDWELAGDEAAEILSAYLAVDTVNPPGNEEAGATWLADLLDREGIATEIVSHAPGRSSLIARLEGTGEGGPPLCLLSHIDVVPAEAEHWAVPPFEGRIEEGVVWGRGALDMKGLGVLQALTLAWLARLDVPLQRDVVLLAVADEEVGHLGIEDLVDNHWDRIGCSHLINEGGVALRDGLIEGQTVHSISVAEKGVLWVEMVASGPPGHGSTPREASAPLRLLEAMAAIDERKARPRFDPAMRELLWEAGRHTGGFTGAVLRSPVLTGLFVRPRLMSSPTTQALITDTVHLTGMRGAVSPNVVPSEAVAVYDCRLLPGTDPQDVLAELRHLTRRVEGIDFRVLAEKPSMRSPTDDPLFRTMGRYAVEGRPDHVAAPLLSVGFTDSLFVRQIGVHAYGYMPFVLTEEELQTMHGHDERVSVENLREGLRILLSIVVDFTGEAPSG